MQSFTYNIVFKKIFIKRAININDIDEISCATCNNTYIDVDMESSSTFEEFQLHDQRIKKKTAVCKVHTFLNIKPIMKTILK